MTSSFESQKIKNIREESEKTYKDVGINTKCCKSTAFKGSK